MTPTFKPVALSVDADHPAYRALVPTSRYVGWSDRPVCLLVEVLYLAEGRTFYGRTPTPGFYIDVTPVGEDESGEPTSVTDGDEFRIGDEALDGAFDEDATDEPDAGDGEDAPDAMSDDEAMWEACGFIFETGMDADLDEHPAADAILLTALARAIEPALPALAAAWAADNGDCPWIANAILTGAVGAVSRDPALEMLHHAAS